LLKSSYPEAVKERRLLQWVRRRSDACLSHLRAVGSQVHRQRTGYESGLDMFGARYYGSSLGRFMTPDWSVHPALLRLSSENQHSADRKSSIGNRQLARARLKIAECLAQLPNSAASYAV